MAARPTGGLSAPAPLPAAWLAALAADDLMMPAEVAVASVPPRDSLARNICVVTDPTLSAVDDNAPQRGQHSGLHLAAARAFAPGELVLAEVAVAFLPADAVPPTGLDAGDGGATAPLIAPHVRFAGPFNARREAAIRVVAQLPPRRAGESDPGAAAGSATRGDLLASSFRARSLLVACGAGNPYTQARERGRAPEGGTAATGSGGSGGGDAAAPTSPSGQLPPAAGSPAAPPSLARFHAVFTRSALLGHSCAPNTAYVSVFEPHPVAAPALQLYASRAVPAGERLTVALTDPVAARPERRARLLQRYGFLCDCPRCDDSASTEGGSSGDDAVAVRCVPCLEKAASAAAATAAPASECGVWRPGSGAACALCGAAPPPDVALYTRRAQALAEWADALRQLQPAEGGRDRSIPDGDDGGVSTALACLRAVLHDADAGVMGALHAALPLLAAADATGARAADAAAALAAAGDAAAGWVPPHRRVDWHVEAALLAGAAERPDASARHWAAARDAGAPVLAASAPALLETFAAFAAKPPRNRREAALADKMRLEVAAWAH